MAGRRFPGDRRRGDRGRGDRWRRPVAALALAAGLGLLLVVVLDRPKLPPVVSIALAPAAPALPGHDPLAHGAPALIGPKPPAATPPAAADEAPAPDWESPGVTIPPPPAPPSPAVARALPPTIARPELHPDLRPEPRPAPPADGRPLIAIVIDDMGLDRRHSAEVIDLPAPLTLSFMTYAEDLAAQTAAGRRHGHEIMLHVPMEPLAVRVDPGPNALRIGQDTEEIRRRLEWGLARIDGIVGINNHMGSRFTESIEGMTPVMAVLHAHGLFFLDSRTTPRSVGIEAARVEGVPHAARDVFLDVAMTDPAVAAEIARTEAIARKNGLAIAIGHPHPATIEELRRWLPQAEARGFRLVPVSEIVRRNSAAADHGSRPAG